MMYHITGNEKLYLLGIKAHTANTNIAYTLSVDYERIIYHKDSPILFKNICNAQNAILKATHGEEKLLEIDMHDCYVYDFDIELKNVLNFNKSSAENTLLPCLNFLLDFCDDTQHIPKDLFDLKPVCCETEESKIFKCKKYIKDSIPQDYMYYKHLFEASEYFFLGSSYREYNNHYGCSRYSLADAIKYAMNLFFTSAFWID